MRDVFTPIHVWARVVPSVVLPGGCAPAAIIASPGAPLRPGVRQRGVVQSAVITCHASKAAGGVEEGTEAQGEGVIEAAFAGAV